MDKNALQRLLGLVDYNFLYGVYKLSIGGCMLLCFSDLSRMVPLLTTLDVAMMEFAGRYTKDVQEVYRLYQEFINNYVKLNKKFYLDNPVEIWTMYSFLLYGGYLSKDKEFRIQRINTVDLHPIRGANILAGEGVCRHIAPMMRDILTAQGFKAYNLLGSLREESIWAKAVMVNTKSHEEQLGMIDESMVDEEIKNNLKDYLYRRWSVSRETDVVLEIERLGIESIMGNHIICLAEDEENSYYLDSMHGVIYDKEGDLLVGSHGNATHKVDVKFLCSWLFNNLGDLRGLSSSIVNSKPTLDRERRDVLIDGTNKIISHNMDVIEDFYKENCELYEEVSDKLMRIRK